MFHRPLCILAFDHRATFDTLVGGPASRREGSAPELVNGCGEILYDAFRQSVDSGAVPTGHAAMLVGVGWCAHIARRAQRAGYMYCTAEDVTEPPGVAFEHGEAWRERVAGFPADAHKALARWDPIDTAANARRAGRLAELSGWLRATGRSLLLELLVEPGRGQLEALDIDADTFDLDHRPDLMVRAIEQLHAAGVIPDIWTVEGVSRREECATIGAAATAHPDAPDAFCVVVGRAALEPMVQHWLSVSAGVPGYGGFALGRSLFGRPIGAWLAEEIDAVDAAKQIAESYAWYVDFYRAAVDEACR